MPCTELIQMHSDRESGTEGWSRVVVDIASPVPSAEERLLMFFEEAVAEMPIEEREDRINAALAVDAQRKTRER